MEILLRLALWNFSLACMARGLPSSWRRPLRWFPPLAVGLMPLQTPVERLAACSLFLLFAIKTTILLGKPRQSIASLDPLGLFLYYSLWPGVDPEPLRQRQAELEFPGGWFVQGWVSIIVSGVVAGALALQGWLTGWAVLLCLFTFLHLGYSDVLSALMRGLGYPVERLFENPLAARSLNEFWSHRWNRPFAEMNRLLLPPRRRLESAFLISGLLHEAALSFPAGAGWGGPLSYFLLQGLLLRREPSYLKQASLLGRRLWTWSCLLLPLPLLFPSAVHTQFLEPLALCIQGLPWFSNSLALKSTLLWLAGWGHFLVLGAGLQVPWRLGWREELPRLRPLNRKLMWVYYGYIGSLIVTFGTCILVLHAEMLAGDRAARVLLTIITAFWSSRLLVDGLVFEHRDWPQGPLFTVGHTLLTSLFAFLALSGALVLFG